MSNSPPSNTDDFRFRLPPRETQLALGICATLLGICALQFETFSTMQLLMLFALFCVGFLRQQAWAIYLMFGTFIVLNYFFVAPYLNPYSASIPQLGESRLDLRNLRYPDIAATLIFILLAATSFRFLETSRFLKAFYPNAKLGSKPKSGIRFQFPSLLGGRWWAIPLAIFLASTLLAFFPFKSQSFAYAVSAEASRLIFLILFLFFAWFICRAAIGIFIRWGMKTEQADVHIRSLIAKEMWRETYPVEKRRAKMQSFD